MAISIVEKLDTRSVVLPSGCREWTGCATHDGYGLIRYNRRMVYAHRLAYAIFVGDIPEGHVVRHKCDNPRCINTAHLETGTHLQNIQDSITRGRWPNRKGKGHVKLTVEQVLKIKRLIASGMQQMEIAYQFDVSQSTITSIKHKRNWAWL